MGRACSFYVFGLCSVTPTKAMPVWREGEEKGKGISGSAAHQVQTWELWGSIRFSATTARISHGPFVQIRGPDSTLSWPEAGTGATHPRPPCTLPDLPCSIPADLEGHIPHHSPVSPCAQITPKNVVPNCAIFSPPPCAFARTITCKVMSGKYCLTCYLVTPTSSFTFHTTPAL